MKKQTLSRRRFLNYTALGAGALALAGPTSLLNGVESSTPAGAVQHKRVVYAPHIVIGDGAGAHRSPNIWVTRNKLSPSSKVTTPLLFGTRYFLVARIKNVGAAPVFNALVNFYVDLRPDRIFAGPIGGPFDSDMSRSHVRLISREVVSIPPRGELDVVGRTPWLPTLGSFTGSALGPNNTHPWIAVVECFEPLTDPLAVKDRRKFHIESDRHVASNVFLTSST